MVKESPMWLIDLPTRIYGSFWPSVVERFESVGRLQEGVVKRGGQGGGGLTSNGNTTCGSVGVGCGGTADRGKSVQARLHVRPAIARGHDPRKTRGQGTLRPSWGPARASLPHKDGLRLYQSHPARGCRTARSYHMSRTLGFADMSQKRCYYARMWSWSQLREPTAGRIQLTNKK